MDTMEITKLVGAICGSLLVFLLINTAAGALFTVGTGATSFVVPVEAATSSKGSGAEKPVDVNALVAAADASKGETVFKKCHACHNIDNTNAVGPHLNGVVNRPVASVSGFNYSDAMKAHGGDWTPERLFEFLDNPKKVVPGTKMSFAGLPKPEDRADVIAFLEKHAQ